MALTESYFESLLCKAADCYSSLAHRTSKDRNYGDEDNFCKKLPSLKKLFSIIYILELEKQARFGSCKPCSCDGQEYQGSDDDLSCPEACLDDDAICSLDEKVSIICDSTAGNCN